MPEVKNRRKLEEESKRRGVVLTTLFEKKYVGLLGAAWIADVFYVPLIKNPTLEICLIQVPFHLILDEGRLKGKPDNS